MKVKFILDSFSGNSIVYMIQGLFILSVGLVQYIDQEDGTVFPDPRASFPWGRYYGY